MEKGKTLSPSNPSNKLLYQWVIVNQLENAVGVYNLGETGGTVDHSVVLLFNHFY